MNDALECVAAVGILPVIAVPSREVAVPLARALVDGGIAAIEVTLRNDCALDAIRAIRAAFPDMAIGAGTILSESQIAPAREAGADFLVAPGLDVDLLKAALAAGVDIVPGVTNPTEITAAVRLGLKTLKFFPAEISGGVPALTLYHGPFQDVKFVPTGGMTMDNIGAYLAKPFVSACGGSYMAKSSDIKAGQFDLIRENSKRCVAIAREART
ncbi:MAG: KHG/KDPG aldolase [Verrucomicrobia bacterium ADurb.Bin345]|nr:MAG: KHG/KDPG aldolase [Verrucomicrobia bacterium ADurb.Bin345]